MLRAAATGRPRAGRSSADAPSSGQTRPGCSRLTRGTLPSNGDGGSRGARCMDPAMAGSWHVAAFTLVAVTAAPALGQLTKDEQACQQEASKQTATFLGKKIKCLVACDKRALKGKALGTDCLPPFGGQALECVGTAEAKARGSVAKKCALDCPECYAGGDCGAHAAALIGGVEAHVDAVIPIVRCDDSASPDGLTKNEAKVRQKVAVVVSSFLGSSEKCLAKCRKQEAAGTVVAGGCDSGAETDQKTIDCLVKAA